MILIDSGNMSNYRRLLDRQHIRRYDSAAGLRYPVDNALVGESHLQIGFFEKIIDSDSGNSATVETVKKLNIGNS